jgi:hypothetical protein
MLPDAFTPPGDGEAVAQDDGSGELQLSTTPLRLLNAVDARISLLQVWSLIYKVLRLWNIVKPYVLILSTQWKCAGSCCVCGWDCVATCRHHPCR